MSIFKKLFGGGVAPEAEPESHNGFTIRPEPIRDGDQWRICAVIEKDGRTHRLIRADTMGDRGQAVEASVGKARQMIDEQGERLFG